MARTTIPPERFDVLVQKRPATVLGALLELADPETMKLVAERMNLTRECLASLIIQELRPGTIPTADDEAAMRGVGREKVREMKKRGELRTLTRGAGQPRIELRPPGGT